MMAKKQYSINWEDDEPVSFEVNGVRYESLEDVPDDEDRLRLEAMMNSAEDAAFDAEFKKAWAEGQQKQGTPIEKIILPIFTGVAILLLLITAVASVSNIRKIGREESAPGRVVDVKMLRSYVNEEDRVVQEYYYPVVEFVARDGRRRSVQMSEGSYPASYEVGDDVTVLYEPDHPIEARIQSFSSTAGMWILPVITGIIGIGFLIAVLAVVKVMGSSETSAQTLS
ncbi:MAG: DUF3592 domain-containing protein [Bacteroidota bacterium]